MAANRSNRSGIGGNMFVLLMVLIVVVGFVAGAGLIMAVVNYSNNMSSGVRVNIGDSVGSQGPGPEDGSGETLNRHDDVHYDTKTWSLQVSGDGYDRVSYIDRKSRRFGGYLFDVVNAVCLIAGKNCALVHSDFSNCWNNGFPQGGILGGWYDACSLWGVTLNRQRSLKFSAPFTQLQSPKFVTLPGNPLNFDPNSIGTEPIGFLNGWWADRFCLFFSKDVDILDSQVFVYDDPNSGLAALQQREVNALFVSESIAFPSGSVQVVEVTSPCLQGGNAMMTRQDSLFREWWDPAFETLTHSREYREICSDIEDPNVHGDKPGGNADQICV